MPPWATVSGKEVVCVCACVRVRVCVRVVYVGGWAFMRVCKYVYVTPSVYVRVCV